jgi:hypothetical protein
MQSLIQNILCIHTIKTFLVIVMLFLSLSCLQGREMQSAAQYLMSLGADGLQLTPGNAPSEKFRQWVSQQNFEIRTHHGFCWNRLRQNVWDSDYNCLVNSHSVHPPKADHEISQRWKYKAEQGEYQNVLLETMYADYYLGSKEEILWAMAVGLNLAVDVSHIYIQLCQGSLDILTWQKLQEYPNIKEFHISANNGKGDIHQPINSKTFGLEWIKHRTNGVQDVPVVLECYMHHLSLAERQEQVNLVSF